MITTVSVDQVLEYFQCRQCFNPLPMDYFHHATGFCSEACRISWRIQRYGNYKPFKNHDRPVSEARKLDLVVKGQSPTGKKAPHVNQE